VAIIYDVLFLVQILVFYFKLITLSIYNNILTILLSDFLLQLPMNNQQAS